MYFQQSSEEDWVFIRADKRTHLGSMPPLQISSFSFPALSMQQKTAKAEEAYARDDRRMERFMVRALVLWLQIAPLYRQKGDFERVPRWGSRTRKVCISFSYTIGSCLGFQAESIGCESREGPFIWATGLVDSY